MKKLIAFAFLFLAVGADARMVYIGDSGGVKSANPTVNFIPPPAGGGGGEITFVQSTFTYMHNLQTATITFQSEVAAGNTIVCGAAGNPTVGAVEPTVANNAPTDSGSPQNQYVLISSGVSGGGGNNDAQAIWVAKNVSGGTLSINITPVEGWKMNFACVEYSGANTSNPVGLSDIGAATDSNPTSGVVTTATSGEVLIAVLSQHGNAEDVVGAGSGYTMRESHEVAGSPPFHMEDRGSGGGLAAGSYEGNFDNAQAREYGVSVISLKK